MDLYPGLHLGTRNFGGHLGFRYFFTDGFGVYAETAVPIANMILLPRYFLETIITSSRSRLEQVLIYNPIK